MNLDPLLDALRPALSKLAQQHKAYPILHYYHSERAQDSAAVAVAVLDEALTLLRFGLPEDERPNEVLVEAARASVRSHLRTLNPAFVRPADEVPPPPNLDRLRDVGVPTVSDDAFADSLEDLTERRRKLLGAVVSDAWHWPPVDE